jgi:hypothetical protein
MVVNAQARRRGHRLQGRAAARPVARQRARGRLQRQQRARQLPRQRRPLQHRHPRFTPSADKADGKLDPARPYYREPCSQPTSSATATTVGRPDEQADRQRPAGSHRPAAMPSESYAIERVLIEPLPWPGDMERTIDDTNRGVNNRRSGRRKTGDLLYSRGFSTIFGEWRTTEEANKLSRGFGESVRFPKPDQPVRVRILKRDERNEFSVVWSVEVDTDAQDVVRKQPPAPAKPIAIRVSGPSPQKVDLLILGDGYTKPDMPKFEADARRLAAPVQVSPFKERANDFNVWAMAVPTQESGVSRPSTGVHHASALGTRYDIFGSERYVLTSTTARCATSPSTRRMSSSRSWSITTPMAVAASSASSARRRPATTGPTTCSCTNSATTSPAWPTSTTPRRWPTSRAARAWSRGSRTRRRCAIRPKLKWKQHVQGRHAAADAWPKAEYEDVFARLPEARAALRAAEPPRIRNECAVQGRPGVDQRAVLRKRRIPQSDRRLRRGELRGQAAITVRSMQCIMFDRSEHSARS